MYRRRAPNRCFAVRSSLFGSFGIDYNVGKVGFVFSDYIRSERAIFRDSRLKCYFNFRSVIL